MSVVPGGLVPAQEQPSASPAPDNLDPLAPANLVIAEYAALRDEIGRYQEHQRQLINSVFLAVGGTVTLLSHIDGTDRQPVISASMLLLFAPPVYALLALLYADRAVRIIRLAHYIHDQLRPKASDLARNGIWEWESYKTTTRIVSRRVAFFLDKLRWAVFIAPLIATSAFSFYGFRHSASSYRVLVGVVGGVSLLAAVVAAVLTEETNGVAALARRRTGGHS